MAGIAHLGVGLAAKRAAPKAPLVVLMVATEVIDILWGVFALAGLDSMEYSPWCHSLFMSAIWSAIAALLAARVFHSNRTGAVVGILVFSHWILDFITHPMFDGPPDLPLAFDGSMKVGLGLYASLGPGFMAATELGLPILGTIIYLVTRRRSATIAPED